MEKESRNDEPRKIKLAESGSLKTKEESEAANKEKKLKEKADKRWIALILFVSILVTLIFYLLPFIRGKSWPEVDMTAKENSKVEKENRSRSGYPL